MEFLEILHQGLIASLIIVLKLALIILPFMVMVEFAKQYGWMEFISQRSQWFTRVFRLPESAALPVFAGLFIGIVSGSGVILQAAKEENYSRSTLTILFVMIGICHSLFEETVLFLGIDANILIVVWARLTTALLFAYFLGRILEWQCTRLTTEKNTDGPAIH